MIVIIAIILVVGLTLKKPNKDNSSTENNNTQYAKSINLNCPKEITFGLNSKIKLKDNFLSVNPSSMKSKLTIEVTNRSGELTNGLVFENFIVTANKIGYYNLKFSVPSSESRYLYVNLAVNVVDDEEDIKVKQLEKTLLEETSVNINEIFEFTYANLTHNVVIADTAILRLENDNLYAIGIGSSSVAITISTDYVEYTYTFNILVRPKPAYEIKVENSDIVNINIPIYTIYYRVEDSNFNIVNQDIEAESSDENIAVINYVTNPTIQIQFKTKGIVRIILKLKSDNSITKTITIIYE